MQLSYSMHVFMMTHDDIIAVMGTNYLVSSYNYFLTTSLKK